MIRTFEIAVTFLTVFNIKVSRAPTMREIGNSAWAFPLVGIFIGLLLVGVWLLFEPHVPSLVLGALLVTTWVAITGAMHLDGWADCCDALIVPVPRERRLFIMKDSRLGTFGAVGLIILLGLKLAALGSGAVHWTMLIAAPALGRGVVVFCTYKAMSSGEGMASELMAGLSEGTMGTAVTISIACALIAGWTGLLAAVMAYLSGYVLKRFAESRLGGINGDVLGASCELAETAALITATVTW
jgi:adenosylcobinamide-GDP ribazoletransferase